MPDDNRKSARRADQRSLERNDERRPDRRPDPGLEHAARSVGDRWTLQLIGALLDGDRTFSELAEEVDGIAPNILTARLRALQTTALVSARLYARRPPRMRYSLTEPGRRLAMSIDALRAWGARRDSAAVRPTHAACGTPVELRPWCPTCERVVDDDNPEDDALIWV